MQNLRAVFFAKWDAQLSSFKFNLVEIFGLVLAICLHLKSTAWGLSFIGEIFENHFVMSRPIRLG
jgi:hypothetical protein